METVSVVFCFNDSYCIYSVAAISSLIKHTSEKYKYDINILHYDITEYNQSVIKNLNNKKNVNINFTFFDPNSVVGEERLHTWAHFSVDVYTRLFLHKIFPDLDKILFLDADIIITADIANLFNEDINGYSIGACRNYEGYDAIDWVKKLKISRPLFKSYVNVYNYFTNFLKLSDADIESYFNAGVMLIDLKRASKLLELVPKMMDTAYLYNDQDILNSLFKTEKLILDSKYNTAANFVSVYLAENKRLPDIIHFTYTKPTKTMKRVSDNEYWKTISQTDFYYPALEQFVVNKVQQNFDGRLNEIKEILSSPGALEDLYYNLRRTHRMHSRRKYLRGIIKLLVDSKRYRKLKRDPERFFADSKSSFIRFLGKYYI